VTLSGAAGNRSTARRYTRLAQDRCIRKFLRAICHCEAAVAGVGIFRPQRDRGAFALLHGSPNRRASADTLTVLARWHSVSKLMRDIAGKCETLRYHLGDSDVGSGRRIESCSRRESDVEDAVGGGQVRRVLDKRQWREGRWAASSKVKAGEAPHVILAWLVNEPSQFRVPGSGSGGAGINCPAGRWTTSGTHYRPP
jgi:hypothetical protein